MRRRKHWAACVIFVDTQLVVHRSVRSQWLHIHCHAGLPVDWNNTARIGLDGIIKYTYCCERDVKIE
jgi:hypothetical protein